MKSLMLRQFAIAVLTLAPGLLAQGGEADVRQEETSRKREKEAGRNEKREEEEWANLTPEQRLARNVTHGASRFCRFISALRPAKLMPGQSGVMVITAVLQGQAVLPSPAPIEMIAQPQQGPVSLGSLTIKAAEPGRLPTAYLGRPVYDNYAVMEVPVTLASNAEVGKKHLISVDLQFDLYDASSTQPVGRFIDRAAMELEVGAVPDPPIAGGVPARSTAAPAAKPSTPTGDVVSADKSGSVSAPKVIGNAVAPAESPAESSVGVTAAPQPAASLPPPSGGDAGEGLPLVPILGGGALLVLLVVMLLRRK
jgi:hypothetical protein